jgi:hypothetical protein
VRGRHGGVGDPRVVFPVLSDVLTDAATQLARALRDGAARRRIGCRSRRHHPPDQGSVSRVD